APVPPSAAAAARARRAEAAGAARAAAYASETWSLPGPCASMSARACVDVARHHRRDARPRQSATAANAGRETPRRWWGNPAPAAHVGARVVRVRQRVVDIAEPAMTGTGPLHRRFESNRRDWPLLPHGSRHETRIAARHCTGPGDRSRTGAGQPDRRSGPRLARG